MNFERIGLFSGSDPELNRRLVALERNIDRALRQLEVERARAWRPVEVSRDYQAGDGDLVLVDASQGAVDVLLPLPAPGRSVIVVRSKGSNTVRVLPLTGAEISGASSLSVTGSFAWLLSGGTDWWSQA